MKFGCHLRTPFLVAVGIHTWRFVGFERSKCILDFFEYRWSDRCLYVGFINLFIPSKSPIRFLGASLQDMVLGLDSYCQVII